MSHYHRKDLEMDFEPNIEYIVNYYVEMKRGIHFYEFDRFRQQA